MDLKLIIFNSFKIILAATGFLVTFFTIINFTYFVSVPKPREILISSDSK